MANQDPHVNPQTGNWDDNYYQTTGQYGGGGNSPLALYNQYSGQLNNNLTNFTNQQQGFANQQNTLQNTLLGNQNTQALGTQSQGDQSTFLNSILNPQQKQQGALQYGYGLTQGNENATYGLQSTANTQNRQMALDKLANDQTYALKNLGLQQGQQNQATIEGLNQRGMLYGQAPTGGYQPNNIGGLNGVAGQEAGQVNQGFGNQRGQLNSTYGLNVQDTNQQFGQQQNLLNQSHTFNTAENAFNTSNDINQQNNTFGYQSGMNQLQLAQQKAALANQQAQQSIQNKFTAQQLGGRAAGITGF